MILRCKRPLADSPSTSRWPEADRRFCSSLERSAPPATGSTGICGDLDRHWRVVTVDPLGHGDSDTPHDADAYVAAEVTSDLIAVLDAAGTDRATVWG